MPVNCKKQPYTLNLVNKVERRRVGLTLDFENLKSETKEKIEVVFYNIFDKIIKKVGLLSSHQ